METVPPSKDEIDPRAAGAVHDFNNLLSVIMVCADEIRSMPGDGEHRERASEIHAAASRGAELIRELLGTDSGRSPRPQEAPSPERESPVAADLQRQEASAEPRLRRASSADPIDLPEAMERCLPLLGRTLGPSVEINTSYEGDLPPVQIAAESLERILLNLATNSRAAFDGSAPSPAHVVIQSSQVAVRDGDPLLDPGWYVRIAFSDNGGGMELDVAARALEPGFTTKLDGGTGLGLSIVCQIVREAGGDVRLNTTPAVGTTITLYVPIAGEPASPTIERERLSDARGRTS